MVVPLVFVVVAFVGLLILLALRPLLQPAVELIQQLPVVGGYLAGRVVAITFEVERRVLGFAAVGVDMLVGVIVQPVYVMRYFFGRNADAHQANADASMRIVTQVIPRNVALLYSDMVALFTQATIYMQALYNRAVELAEALHAQAISFAQALHAQAINFAQALHAQGVQFTEALHAQAINFAQALYERAISFAQALHAQAIDYTRVSQAQALTFTEDAVGRSIEYERLLYGQAVGYAGALSLQDRAYAEAIGAGAIGFAATATRAVATDLAELKSRDCIKFCNPLGSLGQMLQGLEDLGLAALLIGLAEESIRDPEGTARTVRQLVHPVGADLIHTARSEIGV